MEVYYLIVVFIFGTVLGSFFNVVGYRLPRGESLIFPSSHCTNCNHKLGPSELIPIFSYLFLGGKCKNCHQKISLFYPIFELTTGVLFAVLYLIFGFSIDFLISLVFISTLLIIIISDYQTMIIPDEILVISVVSIVILMIIKSGFSNTGYCILDGIISFIIMFIIKKFGDFLFKKESMGGGDIKLMFLMGIILGWQVAVVSIFLASIIGLPISMILLYRKKEHVIPFGPFLSISAIILYLTRVDINYILSLIVIR